MFIEQIEIDGFRSHVKTVIDGLNRYNLFLGKNGAGKSSILEALGYAFTGTCKGTDEGGKGADSLIHQLGGEKSGSASITLRTKDKGVISRMVGQGPKSTAQNSATAALGVGQELARVIAEPGNFLELDAAKQKNMLLKAVGGEVSSAEILALVPEELKGAGDWARLTRIEAVDAAEKQLREERPLRKREIEALGGAVEAPECPVDADPDQTLAAARTQLAKLRHEREELARSQGAGAGKREALNSELGRLRTERDVLGNALIDAPSKQAILEKIKEIDGQLEGLAAKTAERQGLATKLNSEISAKKQEVRTLTDSAQKLSGLKGGCPTCYQPVDANFKKTSIAEIGGKIKTLESAIAKLQKEYAAAEQAGLEEDGTALRNDANTLQQAVADIDRDLARTREVDDRIEELQKQITELPEDATAAEDVLTPRIEKGETLIRALEQFVILRDQVGVVGKKRTQLESRLELLEKSIELLGPKGPIRARLLAGGLDDFLGMVNNIAMQFGLPELEIQVDPWKILAGGRPAALLSASESYRLGIAFAGVFAKVSGVGFLCLDGMDILDAAGRQMLPHVLDLCGLDQAFIASTHNEPEEARGQGADGWSIYSVTGGQGIAASSVTSLKEEAAAAAEA